MKKLLLVLLCLPFIGFGQCISGNCVNGQGTFTWGNGDKYVGEWRNDMMHGQGTYTYSNGTIVKGPWINGIEEAKIVPIESDDIVEIVEEAYIETTESDETVAVIEIEKENEDEFFLDVETMPIFRYYEEDIINKTVKVYFGDSALMKYISKNVKYPNEAKEYNITGKVYVSYIVDKSGSVTDVKIVRGVDKSLDAETVRVVKSLPGYIPGTQRGKPVRVMFTIPINFTLN